MWGEKGIWRKKRTEPKATVRRNQAISPHQLAEIAQQYGGAPAQLAHLNQIGQADQHENLALFEQVARWPDLTEAERTDVGRQIEQLRRAKTSAT
jgi:hypothetical protein